MKKFELKLYIHLENTLPQSQMSLKKMADILQSHTSMIKDNELTSSNVDYLKRFSFIFIYILVDFYRNTCLNKKEMS